MAEVLLVVCGREEEGPDGVDNDGEENMFWILAAGFFKYEGQEVDDTGSGFVGGYFSWIVDSLEAPTLIVGLSCLTSLNNFDLLQVLLFLEQLQPQVQVLQLTPPISCQDHHPYCVSQHPQQFLEVPGVDFCWLWLNKH